jgi:hypothetical protein
MTNFEMLYLLLGSGSGLGLLYLCFKFGKMAQKLDSLEIGLKNLGSEFKSEFEKIDNTLNEIKTSMHKLDVRLATIEGEHRMYPWPMVINEDVEPRRRAGRPKRVLVHKEN